MPEELADSAARFSLRKCAASCGLAFVLIAVPSLGPGYLWNMFTTIGGKTTDLGPGAVLVINSLFSLLIGWWLLWSLSVFVNPGGPAAQLRLRPASVRAVAAACAAGLLLCGYELLLYRMFGEPLGEQVWHRIYAEHDRTVLLFIAVALAPLLEEPLYRGFLLTSFRASGLPSLAAVFVTAVIFALSHGRIGYDGLVLIFSMGLLFGLASEATGSIVPSLAMHSVTNLVWHCYYVATASP